MTLSIEQKVGIFFIIGLVILGIITFKVEDWGALFKRQHLFYAHFPHASGLNTGDTVAVAGLKVGEIKAVDLEENGVRMTLAVDAKVRIHSDAIATIAWGGLLGNRYIDITLGTPGAGVLEPKSEIRSKPSVEITDVLAKLDAAAGELRDMFKGSGVGPKLSVLVDNLTKISADIAEGRGTIGKLVESDEMYQKITAIADDLKNTSDRVNKLVSSNDKRISSIIENLEAAAPEVKEAFATIRRIGEQVDTGKGILPALLKDEKMYDDLRNALARLSTSMDRIEKVTQEMQQGKGLIGKLSNDPQLADDFGEMVKSLRAIAQRLETGNNTLARLTRDEDLYKDIKKLIDDARETLRSAKEQVPVGTFAGVLLSAF